MKKENKMSTTPRTINAKYQILGSDKPTNNFTYFTHTEYSNNLIDAKQRCKKYKYSRIGIFTCTYDPEDGRPRYLTIEQKGEER